MPPNQSLMSDAQSKAPAITRPQTFSTISDSLQPARSEAPALFNPKLTFAAPTGTVSAEQIAAPRQPVTVPTPTAPTVPDTSLAQSVAENNQAVITGETEAETRRNELRDEYTALNGEGSLQSVFEEGLQGGMVPQNLKRLQEVQIELNRLAKQSGLAQVGIEGAAGQTLATAGREVTQEQREAAVRSAALASESSILQGNIETATQLASQAVGFAYQDRLVRNQNLINQINFLQGDVDDERSERLVAQQRVYERENQQIGQAISAVNSAVASGFASPDDVATMTSLSGDPQAQKEYADKIIARASRTQYQNALAATYAAQSAARANAATEAQGEAQAQAIGAQTALDVVEFIKQNPLGIKAIAGSTGFGRTSISTALEGLTKGFVGGTAAGAVGGSIIPGAGTIGGGAVGGVLGAIGGATAGTFQASKQRADVATGLGYLVNSGTFNEMRRLKAGGVTFGSLTEGERKAIGAAADELFSALEVSDDGAVTAVRTSEENFARILNNFEQKQQQYLREANAIAAGMTAEDYEAIQNQGQ